MSRSRAVGVGLLLLAALARVQLFMRGARTPMAVAVRTIDRSAGLGGGSWRRLTRPHGPLGQGVVLSFLCSALLYAAVGLTCVDPPTTTPVEVRLANGPLDPVRWSPWPPDGWLSRQPKARSPQTSRGSTGLQRSTHAPRLSNEQLILPGSHDRILQGFYQLRGERNHHDVSGYRYGTVGDRPVTMLACRTTG